jgi:hypothetical protein
MTRTANLRPEILTQDLPNTERERQPLDHNAVFLGSVMVVSLHLAQMKYLHVIEDDEVNTCNNYILYKGNTMHSKSPK